jgi:hypothetical protein
MEPSQLSEDTLREREAARIANERPEEREEKEDENRQKHGPRMSERRKENARIAELESKIDGSFFKHGIY